MYTKSGVSGMAYANTFQRMEIKYLLTSQQTEAVLQKISGFMIEDEYSRQTICSLYCDSPDDILARISLDKPVYKEKLRLRAYGTPTDSSPVFLEIKKKYDGVVYKRRVSTDFAQAMRFLTEGIPPESGDYVARQVTAEMTHMIRRDGLIPRAAVFYDRRAFHGADDPELRLTLDGNIRYRLGDLDLRHGTDGDTITGQPFRIMEIKSASSIPLWLAGTLSELGIRPGSFSKYGSVYKQRFQDLCTT